MGCFKIPGVLGSTAFSGQLKFANLGTKGARKLARKLAEREIGPKILRIVFSKKNVRFVGKQWELAFQHIAESHFNAKTALAAGRATAGIFLDTLRTRSAIEALITATVKRSSHRVISRQFVHNAVAGEPVIIVEREFGHVIGETFKFVGKEVVKDSEKVVINGIEREIWNGDCKVLRVIYNIVGEVITAFPVRAINSGL